MAKEITLAPVLGTLTATSWTAPKNMTEEQWRAAGATLARMELAVAWWIGDWWAFGSERKWGEGVEFAAEAGLNYATARSYGSVSRAFELSNRLDKLSFTHHLAAMAVPPKERGKWLQKAIDEEWSVGKLRAEIARAAAVAKTQQIEMDAKKLGKYAVLYADPPWRYEHPPMGGGNRSIENHYPTMTLEEIKALPVGDLAHENSVLFLWATSPKLPECLEVVKAWGFECRTTMAWVKDKIGMGYYVREQHELLLICKRGELPPPDPSARPSSVVDHPRGDHSEKPDVLYEIIDGMYQGDKIRKIELFGRLNLERPEHWAVWGNDVAVAA